MAGWQTNKAKLMTKPSLRNNHWEELDVDNDNDADNAWKLILYHNLCCIIDDDDPTKRKCIQPHYYIIIIAISNINKENWKGIKSK